MRIPITAEQLADMVGYGDLYRASEEQEEKDQEMTENIRNMMMRVEEASRKRLPDFFD